MVQGGIMVIGFIIGFFGGAAAGVFAFVSYAAYLLDAHNPD